MLVAEDRRLDHTKEAPMTLFGIDTSQPASEPLRVRATEHLTGGTNPKFWGRYFNGDDDMSFQYKPSENAFLRGLGIPVLCFARQMKFVGDAYASVARRSREEKHAGRDRCLRRAITAEHRAEALS